jgi:putative nucleotidyltransferase with HDIG domain
MADMKIPSKKECYKLIGKMEMMDHIVSHSILVSHVATFLVDQLEKQQANLNRDMVQASALLHDITKTRSFKTKENHAHTGEHLLHSLGYLEVGYIIGQHVRLETYDTSTTILEAEIVNYADKRVLHDKVVSLKDRMTYILSKYGKVRKHRQRILWLWGKTKELEEKIFKSLPLSPEDLSGFLNPEGCKKEFFTYSQIGSPSDQARKK